MKETKRANGTNASGAVTTKLRQALASGELRPDDPVYEEDWARRLKVSRTPVREAIQELVARGLLTRRGRTAFVFRPSLPELLDIYDIRLPLEQLAARRCAEKADARLIATLEKGFDKIKDSRADSDWYVEHEAFHMKIFHGSDVPRLVEMIEVLRSQSEPYVRFAIHVDQRFRDHSRVQHGGLLDAVKQQDPDKAASIVEEHLATTRAKMADLMQITGDTFEPLMRTLGR